MDILYQVKLLTAAFELHLGAGDLVAQFKFTVLLMANGPLRITNSLFEPELFKSEHEVDDPELKVKYLISFPRKRPYK